MDEHLAFLTGRKYDAEKLIARYQKHKDDFADEAELNLYLSKEYAKLGAINKIIKEYEYYYHRNHNKCAWTRSTKCICRKEKAAI